MIDPLQWYEYRVVLHVHSRYSDGSGSVPEILAAAQAAGVDVLWLTDHDTRAALADPGPGYYGHVLCLVGTEITPPTNHYLVFGDVPPIEPSQPFSEIIRHVASFGGAGFVAHPEDRGNRMARLPSYRWTDRAVDGFTGLEVRNHLSDWSREITGLARGLWAALHPYLGLEEARGDVLALWDTWGKTRRVVGIGGTDAHQARVGAFRIFPYRVSFRGIRTHLYTPRPLPRDWRAAEALLVDALKTGRASVVNAQAGSELGFRLWAERHGDRIEPMGSEIAYSPGWKLCGLAPVPVFWQLYHQGILQAEEPGTLFQWPLTAPGVWRVVLRRGRHRTAWIYSNPIYLR
ncbi:MAG: CehA/McbA family metallohydrolase [Firmicutes bacterium]|nr:CehA/McbA family metallohydrolase [Bacillota bacterium]